MSIKTAPATNGKDAQPKLGRLLLQLVLAAAAVLAVTLYLYGPTPVSQPKAVNGILDLAGWSFQQDGIIRLDGQWEFYRGVLLAPEDFDTAGRELGGGYATVPSDWRGTGAPALGCGTYRLKVRLPETGILLGLKISSIRMSHRIYADGVLVGQSGAPAAKAQDYAMANTPYVTAFAPRTDELEIIVQVANFDYMAGGIVNSFYLGQRADVFPIANRNNTISALVAASLLITGVYYLLVHLGRRKDKSTLYFSVYVMLVALFIVTYGEKILMQMFPGIPFALLFRLENVCLYTSSVFMCLFVQQIAKGLLPRWFVPGVVLVMGGYATLYVILPIAIVSRAELVFLLICLATYGFIVLLLAIAIARNRCGEMGRAGALHLLVAFCSVLVCIVVGILFVNNRIGSDSLGTMGFLLFVGIISVMLSGQYNAATRTIEQMNTRLLQMDALKDEFLTNTSHELRTPLNGIINLAQSVANQSQGVLDARQLQDLRLVVSSGKRLSNLINDILDISTMRHNSLKLACRPVDARAVASSVLYVMETLRPQKDVALVNAIPADLPAVWADEERLRQVYYNLLGNAIKFTGQGSITAGGRMAGCMVELWVEDTGCGIPESRQDEIFQSYYHTDSQDLAGSGTGLGLSVTRQLIELHGGTLAVRSMVGEGSRFTFTLPVSADQAETAAEEMSVVWQSESKTATPLPVAGDGGATWKYSILVADDDPTSLRALSAILGSADYRITAVTNGQEALDELGGSAAYDLVILDIMMPRLDGLQALRQLRRRFTAIELPVLLLTAKARQEDIKAGLEAGANDYITKPFEAEELTARVATLVRMKTLVSSLLSSELSFLQAQIKPHFLYNALSVISSLSIREPAKAKDLLLSLSDYLRGCFQFEHGSGFVQLSTELQTVRAYLAIEKERFKERLCVEVDIDETIAASVPVLSIQPLVENAVRHGIMAKVEGGTVSLSVRRVPGGVAITVRDDGPGIAADRIDALLHAEGAGGVGLRNIQKRTMQLYGQGLCIQSHPGQGTAVTLTIPVQG